MNYYRDVYVLCPFYDSGTNYSIQCEGLEGTTATKLLFIDSNKVPLREQRAEYSRKYCEGNYEACKICQALLQKYEVIKE